MNKIKYFVFCVIFVVLGVACDDPECQRDTDCFADEWCSSGTCTVGPRPTPNNSSNTNNATTGSNNQVSNNQTTAPNNTNNTNNTTTNPNNTNPNNSTSNNSNNTTSNNSNNNEPGGICKADLFDACEDPLEATKTDNSWSSARQLGSSGGCLSGDTITERTNTAEGIICPREPGDWYNQIIIPCDTVTLTVEVRVTPDPGCESDEWNLAINRGGARIPCTDARLNCFEEGATKVVRWSIPPSNSVESWYFGVENGESSMFTYEAELKIR